MHPLLICGDPVGTGALPRGQWDALSGLVPWTHILKASRGDPLRTPKVDVNHLECPTPTWGSVSGISRLTRVLLDRRPGPIVYSVGVVGDRPEISRIVVIPTVRRLH
jgi:hypothetical protein